MKRSRLLIPCVAFVVGAMSACRRAEAPPPEPKPVRVAEAKAGGTAMGLRLPASVQPRAEVALAFKSGGYVERIASRPGPAGSPRSLAAGDAVRAGETLVALREADFDDQVKVAAGQMTQAKAALDRADYEFKRAERLKSAASITGVQHEAQRAARDAALGALQTATAMQEQAEQARRDAALRAPFDGVVVRRMVEVGELGRPGIPVLVLADLSEVKAVVGISDRMLPLVRAGDAVTLQADALRRDFGGRVMVVAPVADAQSRLFPVEILVPNRDGALRPGMVVTVAPGSSAPAAGGTLIPLAALRRPSGGSGEFAVMVLDGSQARERRVEVGGVDGNAILVTRGLAAGERVVTLGLAGLRDGDSVVVLP